MKTYKVYTKLQKRPHAIFENYSHALRYVNTQQKTWTNAKFRIEVSYKPEPNEIKTSSTTKTSRNFTAQPGGIFLVGMCFAFGQLLLVLTAYGFIKNLFIK